MVMYQHYFLRNTKKDFVPSPLRIPNLVEVQRTSFFYFLKFGLQEELERHQVWIQKPFLERTLYPKRLCFEIPNRSYQETLRLGGDYSTRVFIPRSFYDRKDLKIIFEWVVLGNIPLLTHQGHFLINGSPRVCITQVVRGPGLYTNMKIDGDGKMAFSIDLVPERGVWVRLEKNQEGQILLNIRKEPRLPLWLILQAMRISSFPVVEKRNIRITFIPSISQEKPLSNLSFFRKRQKKNFRQRFLYSTSTLLQKKNMKLVYLTRKFSNLRTYDLGKIGRKRFNECFQENFPLSLRFLVPTDFLNALKELNKINQQSTETRFEDVDSLSTRRLRAVGDLIKIETGDALIRFERMTRQNLDSLNQENNFDLAQLISTEPFNQAFRRFITTNPLLQFADQLNPLADLTQKRRLTGLGPGGLSLSNRKIEVRTIHPSHFGRVCPVETPEGQNAGIVNSPTLIRRWNPDGCLQASIVKMSNGWWNPRLNISSSKPQILFLTARKKDDWVVQIALGLLTDVLGQIKIRELLVRSDVEARKFAQIDRNRVELRRIGPEQRLALGPNLIPFLDHDDGNRVLIGANMLRQALPALKVTMPYVSSGLDIYTRNDSGQNLRARWAGVVSYASSQRILIHSQINPGTVIRHHQVQYFQRKKIPLRFLLSKSHFYLCAIEYRLRSFFRSNQSTWRRQRLYVQEGTWVQPGDLLADCSSSLHGFFAAGQNLLIGYIPWDGLNFEDAMVVSEYVKYQETFTSTHIEQWETSLQRSSLRIETFVPFSFSLARRIQGRQQEFFLESTQDSNKKLSLIWKKKRFFFFKNLLSLKTKEKKKGGLKIFRLIKKSKIKNNKEKNYLKMDISSLNVLRDFDCFTEYKRRSFLRKKKKIVFFQKSYFTKFFKSSLLYTQIFRNQEMLTRKKNKWNLFFPGYKSLDNRGIVKVGEWVEPRQILALRVRTLAPHILTPYERLLFDVLDREPPTIRNTSFRVPEKIRGRILNVEVFPFNENRGPSSSFNKVQSQASEKKSLDKDLISNEITFLSKISQFNSNFFFKKQFKKREKMGIVLNKTLFKFPKKTIVFPQIIENIILKQDKKKVTLRVQKTFFIYFSFSSVINKNERLDGDIFDTNYIYSSENYFANVNYQKHPKHDQVTFLNNHIFIRIRFTIAIHRSIQIGDKLAGRHGNKGILSQFIPIVEIPYLPNGMSLDLVFNPLGIPSRMNVGQIYESVIGLAGFFLGERYLLPSFDDRNQLNIASRSLVLEKLREARIKTYYPWLFKSTCPGKIPLFDGRTNQIVNQELAIGNAYILKLVHIVSEKLHARSTGPYSLITQQPVRGRARNGGQRVGEIEIWALEGFGSAHILQEILTVKSDDLTGRGSILSEALFYNRSLVIELPDAFRVLSCELQALCLDVFFFSEATFL
nr:beta subunit of RNA polymerase [Dinophyceae sp. MRD-151]